MAGRISPVEIFLGILENREMLIFQDFCQHAGSMKEEERKKAGRELTQFQGSQLAQQVSD